MQKLVVSIAVFSLTAIATVCFSADTYCPKPAVKHHENIPYISGGVGDEELEMMKSASSEYNLKLVFAYQDGEFLADIAVNISDAGGKTALDAVSDGPWFLANLPPGTYSVTASMNGNKITQRTKIQGAKQSTLNFYWKTSCPRVRDE
jgi:hypothetical protein